MHVTDITLKLLGITQAMRRWQEVFADAEGQRRDRIAKYAEAIAETLDRAAAAYGKLERDPRDKIATRSAIRELSRIKGYVENIVDTLEGRVDGRQVAGLKKRLEPLATDILVSRGIQRPDSEAIVRLAAAEGWFRALADSLRA